jgi:excisionase family DNA binding protein
MPDEDLLTPAEVADLCRVSKPTVFRWVEAGDLEAIRLGKRVIRFRRADVDRFLGAA